MTNTPYTKILFNQMDEEGKSLEESLWAIKVEREENLYRVENIPFSLQNIAYHDIVRVELIENQLLATGIVQESGYSTIRIYFHELGLEKIQEVQDYLTNLNCNSEKSNQLMAVAIPPQVDYLPIQGYLEEGENKGWWEYEEGCLAH